MGKRVYEDRKSLAYFMDQGMQSIMKGAIFAGIDEVILILPKSDIRNFNEALSCYETKAFEGWRVDTSERLVDHTHSYYYFGKTLHLIEKEFFIEQQKDITGHDRRI